MSINLKEIQSVSKLKTFDRYKYLIKKVADYETLFLLKSIEGNFAISEIENKRLLPIWSHKQYAELNLNEGWTNFVVFQISLQEFIDDIYEFILENDYLLNVFPLNNKTGFVVDLDEFKRDLSLELENYL